MTRAQQKVKTRNGILEASIKLFKVHGIENTKIAEIAKEANVSVGTFYVHFKSKEDIVSAIYYEGFNRFMNEKIDQIETTGLSLKDILLEVGILELQFVENVGLEITTAAFIANLRINFEIPGNHFKNRTFSEKIQSLIINDAESSEQDSQTLFEEFETIVRGIMLTWCFKNATMNIVDFGTPILKKYIL